MTCGFSHEGVFIPGNSGYCIIRIAGKDNLEYRISGYKTISNVSKGNRAISNITNIKFPQTQYR